MSRLHATLDNVDPNAGYRNLITAGALTVLYTIVLVRTAWLCDDAYISLRTVDNFIQGYGLRWNIAERVQVFTHPLWVLLLSAVCSVTRELYLTTIVVSITAAITAYLLLVVNLSRSTAGMVIGGLILLLAPGFVSFSTSGLESPLSFVIAALFLITFCNHEPGPRRSIALGFYAGLAAMNRFDLVILFLPALVFDLFENRNIRSVRMMAIGMVPFAAWLVFALVYYGFVFPNSAYAKLSTGIARSDYVRQGIKYLYDALARETLMTLTIAAALIAVGGKDHKRRMLSLGILLYIGYLVAIGGDFMRGRMLAVPLIMAVGILVDANLFVRRKYAVVLLPAMALVVVFLGFNAPNPTIFSGVDCGKNIEQRAYDKTYGIADEREYYFQINGLFNGKPLAFKVGHDMTALRERQAREIAGIKTLTVAGVYGMLAGPSTYAIDRWGLGDALMARLPIRDENWRIGHFLRRIPAGYPLSLVTGENLIQDERLREYYESLRLITRGRLFSRPRGKAIISMNLGRFAYLTRGNTDYRIMEVNDYVALAEADIEAPAPRLLWPAAKYYCLNNDLASAAPMLERLSQFEIAYANEYIPEAVAIARERFLEGETKFGEQLLRLLRYLEAYDPRPAYTLGSLLCGSGRIDEGIPHLEAAARMGDANAKIELKRFQRK